MKGWIRWGGGGGGFIRKKDKRQRRSKRKEWDERVFWEGNGPAEGVLGPPSKPRAGKMGGVTEGNRLQRKSGPTGERIKIGGVYCSTCRCDLKDLLDSHGQFSSERVWMAKEKLPAKVFTKNTNAGEEVQWKTQREMMRGVANGPTT